MKPHIKSNRQFFYLISLWTILGAIYLCFYEKAELIYFFNDHRTPELDFFFKYVTKLGEEPAYILIVFFLMLKKIRHGLLIGVIGFVVMGLSFFLKALFMVDRPLAFFRKNNLIDEINLVQGIDIHTGATSFPSGHAMSAFALYGLLILYLPKKKRYVYPLFMVAVIIAFSRVYLVQHFFPDVYVGSLIGVSLAWLLFALDQKLIMAEDHFIEKPLWKQ